MISLNTVLIKELSLLPKQSKIMVIGEADTGKSTIITTLAHWFLNKSQKLLLLPDMGHLIRPRVSFPDSGTEHDIPAINHKQRFISIGKHLPMGKNCL